MWGILGGFNVEKSYENNIIKELQKLNDICNAQPCWECEHRGEQPCGVRVKILELESIVGD